MTDHKGSKANEDEPIEGKQNTSIPPDEVDPTKIRIERDPTELVSGLLGFLKRTLSLRDGSYDIKSVTDSVKEGIVFKGYNVWILICSIVVASVGLNMNSNPVIIGAMLISPLMGPIRGIGFGVGVNDFKLLIDSVKNFGIMAGISLATSVIYFLITPIHDTTSELFGRTEPNFLDVVIAFFGGMAGAIAHSKSKADTVIPGVAIATALMPPLCTAGYGLANAEWTYFFGASYLFLLNSLLIGISTFLFIRYLNFPKKTYLSPKIEKRVKAYTLLFVLVTVAPSGYMFYKMTKRSIFESNSQAFVKEVVEMTNENIVVTPTYEFDWEDSKIHLAVANYYAGESTLEMWNRQKDNYSLQNVSLHIKQDQDVESLVDQKLLDYDMRNKGANTLAELISQKETKLTQLERKLKEMEQNSLRQKDPLEMVHLLAGLQIDYPEYENIYINRSYKLNKNNKLDTIYAVSVVFKEPLEEDEKRKLNAKISKRIRFELKEKARVKQDSVQVIEMNKQK
ncbi:MAG: DUF389 domain-containing protein [Crocinitomicaceae bacterium]